MSTEKKYAVLPANKVSNGLSGPIALFLLLFWVTFGQELSSNIGGAANASTDGSAIRPLVIITALAFAFGATTWSRLSNTISLIPTTIVVALVWCWLSMTWAVVPDIAVRRLLVTSLTVSLIFVIVAEMGVEKSLEAMRIFFAVTLILNFASVFALPSVGISFVEGPLDGGEIGQWKGFFTQKNITGGFCAITALLFMFNRRPWFGGLTGYVLAALSVLFLYKTGSKTSLGIFIFAVVAGLGTKFYIVDAGSRYIRITLLSIGLLALFWWVTWGNDIVSDVLDDPLAFTGRTQIWRITLAYLQTDWLLGSGYGSFWLVGPNTPALDYQERFAEWAANQGQGHNGYLDIAAQVGVPGLILVLLATIVIPIKNLFRSEVVTSSQRALFVSIFVFIIGNNFMESSILERDVFLEIVLMFCIAWAYHLAPKRKVGGST